MEKEIVFAAPFIDMAKPIILMSEDHQRIEVRTPLSTTEIELHLPDASVNTIRIYDSIGRHTHTIFTSEVCGGGDLKVERHELC